MPDMRERRNRFQSLKRRRILRLSYRIPALMASSEGSFMLGKPTGEADLGCNDALLDARTDLGRPQLFSQDEMAQTSRKVGLVVRTRAEKDSLGTASPMA